MLQRIFELSVFSHRKMQPKKSANFINCNLPSSWEKLAFDLELEISVFRFRSLSSLHGVRTIRRYSSEGMFNINESFSSVLSLAVYHF